MLGLKLNRVSESGSCMHAYMHAITDGKFAIRNAWVR